MRLSASLVLGLVSAALALPSATTAKSSSPVPETFRRPDQAWDFIVKGSDMEDELDKRGEASSSISAYNLRGQSVDPSSLGIDTVKQFSGYLDDDQNDKHLFYCKYITCNALIWSSLLTCPQGSSSLATTRPTTPSSSGSAAAPAAPP